MRTGSVEGAVAGIVSNCTGDVKSRFSRSIPLRSSVIVIHVIDSP